MIEQYPHIISLTTVSNSTQDADGNWIPGVEDTVQIDCRAEPDGGNGFVIGPDQTRIDFGWTVYMKLPVPMIAEGTKVLVQKKVTLEKVCEDTVKQFSPGQLNARIWL